MARPREFNRDEALQKAMAVFWAKGFAATSTDDLLEAMKIGRQSLYNAFGDKRQLYIEALTTYQRNVTAAHLKRLNDTPSPLQGIENLLTGLVAEDERVRNLGCMGIGSVGEFGVMDEELVALRSRVSQAIGKRVTERIIEGQALGEISRRLDPNESSAFVQVTMSGLQLAARGGGGLDDLRSTARFATERLRAT
ncbi:TetR/AcrR family transcriptional regulator [Rhizobium sp. S163]|uniref:TetR/AcrR family transcriptional regulator n=1 Tax=Rhizobium sp. S163 TaxID=3055039 RepID=UPI0025A980CF|nr:TetR/AcrR family transcriptional regulator [Rhizobium sp. S163]MDM9648673.1 TetR/AcrR family transcriptional regulator [Rhizobium sp. S163]